MNHSIPAPIGRKPPVPSLICLMLGLTLSAQARGAEPEKGSGAPPESAESAPPAAEQSREDGQDAGDETGLMGSVDLLFADFDIVISASRSEQSSNMAPAPVSILTAEDIHYSGVGEIPELFAFVPGVDALQVDRNRWGLGVRGMHQTFSDRTLFLVNGRNASNPVYGGIDFQVQPLFLEDIERIEVVRGPGGAAWGANAFNGVVNVIEKSPRDTLGVMASERITEHGDFKTDLRIGAGDEHFAWRFSAELDDVEPSSRGYAIDPGPADTPTGPDDFRRNQRYSFSGVYGASDDTELDFGFGASHVERGDSPFLGLQLGQDERLDLLNGHVKLSREFAPGRTGYVQWYGTYQDVNRPSMYRYSSFDQSLDAQYNFEASEDHQLTLGGTARFVHLDITRERATDVLATGTSEEQWLGVFAGDRWTINSDWTLESQLRLDWYSETMLDWSGRAALLRSLGGSDDHVLRLAMAKAFRTPQTLLRDFESQRLPVGGGLFAVNLIPAVDVDNEELYSIELGYSGKLREGLTLRADAYLQFYKDLTGAILLPEPAPVVGRQFYTIDNIGSASAVGFETELRYHHDRLNASVWYAYNDFDYSATDQNARAFRPARHKVGATLRYAANDWITLNANYRFSDITPADLTRDVPASHRLDLTATFLIENLHAELQLGVLDAFDDTDQRVYDQSSTNIAAQTPGRTLFAQLHMTF